ncbi:MAG: hypothetical protein CVU78_08235 [Elusimicrobia bacterium HGW-Elusimicrobia-2]|nr:MAG: hypothetical protein CVU78_08235 [Elusimicrobia bacterium HGW-Elusimicrobia-2]
MIKKSFFFSVLFLLAGCYSVSRLNLSQAQKQIPRDQRLLIAVIDFDNSTGDPENDAIVNSIYADLVSELAGSNSFRIIERKRMESVLSEMNLQMSGLVDSDKAMEIGKMLGAEALLFGELSSIKYSRNKQSILIMYTEGEKTEVSMNARLIAAESGELLASSSAGAFVKQRNWVAFWFAKLGRTMDKKSVIDTAVELSCRQLASDIARKTYE